MSKKLIFIALALIVAPAYSVENFKISDYGAGVQIWFEVEHFDERNPDDDSSFALGDEPGAYGRSISSINSDDGAGMIRYTFDISAANGSGGTWYFWGRVINPSNQSDFMLVDGHPGDQTPVTTLPVSGLVNGQRVFEENAGSAGTWEWSGDNHNEGHTKELQDGENTMWVLNRQSGAIWDVFLWTNDPGYVPTDADYENALPGKPSGEALRPDPEDGAMITTTWISTTWMPGAFAVSHDIYMGENFDDVNEATVDSPLFRGNLPSNNNNFIAGFTGFPYPGGLVPGATYYWRVDAINEADPNSPWKGDVWSFWIPPTNAYDPSPADGARYVSLDPTLTWQPGLDSKIHNIVFGDNFDEVSNAPAGSSLPGAAFTPGTLEKDKTYYWRVDELNPPATVKGEVWSFTTLPDIPVTDPNLLCWWTFDEGAGSAAVDLSGHDHHGAFAGPTMPTWVPGKAGGALEFAGDGDHVIDPDADYIDGLAAMTVMLWIKSDLVGTDKGFIIFEEPQGRDTRNIRYDLDMGGGLLDGIKYGACVNPGDTDDDEDESPANVQTTDWQHIAVTWASGAGAFPAGVNLYINGVLQTPSTDEPSAEGVLTGYDRVIVGKGGKEQSPTQSWDGLVDDVRIYDKVLTEDEIRLIMLRPDVMQAWDPGPSSNSTLGVDDVLPLTWSAGENASQHDVYFGTDADAVKYADASDTTGVYRGRQMATTFTPAEPVSWGTGPYCWRIDEVKTDGTISGGIVWTFTVSDFTPVDDFESYTDDDPAGEAIFQTWLDGYADPTNGSESAYPVPPYAEQTIVHGGRQSMPLKYNNTGGVMNSEVERKLDSPRDWTKHNVAELSIWFRGRPASDGSFVQNPVGTFTITSKSGDIWGADDELHYGYRTLTGVGEIVARIDSVTNTANWTKCGVMIRETLEPGSKFAAVYLMAPNPDGTPTQGVRFQARTDTDINATSDTSVATQEQRDLVPPYWVKLERDFAGNFRGYYSSNGTAWTPMSWNPQGIPMDSTVFVGLALTSNNTSQMAEAKISNVTITGNVTGQWTSQDIGIAANVADPLYVAISNATGVPAVVAHPDAGAANIDTWTEWVIPLSEFSNKGINLSNVDKIAIGLGTTGGAAMGGSGVMYIDDIRLYRARPVAGQ